MFILILMEKTIIYQVKEVNRCYEYSTKQSFPRIELINFKDKCNCDLKKLTKENVQ